MKTKEVLRHLVLNILTAFICTVIGVIISIVYGFKVWLPSEAAKYSGLQSLAAIFGLISVTVILFGIIGILFGSLFGFILYWIIILILKKSRKKL